MADIQIKRKHALDREQAKAKVEAIARDLKTKLGAEYHWEGDCLCFQRSGASGVIDVKNEVVEVNVKLGMFLKPMKSVIENSINNGFDAALTNSGDSKLT